MLNLLSTKLQLLSQFYEYNNPWFSNSGGEVTSNLQVLSNTTCYW